MLIKNLRGTEFKLDKCRKLQTVANEMHENWDSVHLHVFC